MKRRMVVKLLLFLLLIVVLKTFAFSVSNETSEAKQLQKSAAVSAALVEPALQEIPFSALPETALPESVLPLAANGKSNTSKIDSLPQPFGNYFFENSTGSIESLSETLSEESSPVSLTAGSTENKLELYAAPDSELTGVDENLFSAEDLQFLEKNGADVERPAGFNPGVRTGSGSLRAPSVDLRQLEEEEIIDQTVKILYEGQARGYTMLYLMHPAARATVEAQIDIMLESGVEQLYLGVLTDGTFGKDFSYLQSVLRRLHDAGRRIVLSLYLTNGPTMRRWQSTPITAGFNRIDPERFRDLIRFDPDVRAQFVNMAEEILPTVRQLRQLSSGHRIIITVMLEDNLRRDSYDAMRQLAQSVYGEQVRFIRNPCPNCYSGNDDDAVGDGIEVHSPNRLNILTSRDGFSLDGSGIRYLDEEGPEALSVDEVRTLLDRSLEQGVGYFALWRKERQGIYDDELAHPDSRTYEVPTAAQIELEIELLRQGLLQIEVAE